MRKELSKGEERRKARGTEVAMGPSHGTAKVETRGPQSKKYGLSLSFDSQSVSYEHLKIMRDSHHSERVSRSSGIPGVTEGKGCVEIYYRGGEKPER